MDYKEAIEALDELIDLYLLYLIYKKYMNKSKRRRWWVRPLNLDRDISGYYANSFQQMKRLDSEEFFNNTRMTRNLYDMLLSLVEDDVTKHSLRRPIDAECRLALTLSYLSQGVSIKFLAWSFKMGKSTVREIIIETCSILWKILSPLYVSTPSTADFLEISKQFWEKWNMPNCIGAIDGKHIIIQCPPRTGSDFYNYKKNFSIVLLATCDANYTFSHIAVGARGSQSDGGILKSSIFGKQLHRNELPIPPNTNLPNSLKMFPHYFIGDAAFPLQKHLMRPYSSRNSDESKDIFNYRLSRARRVIENAFGILVNRWRVLRNPINMLPKNTETVVLATVALHNFIKLNDASQKYVPQNFIDWEDQEFNLHSGDWRRNTQPLPSISDRSTNSTRYAFNLRDDLKQYLCNDGAVPFQYKN